MLEHDMANGMDKPFSLYLVNCLLQIMKILHFSKEIA